MAETPLYGIWRLSDDRAKTGWLTALGGRVIVSTDPDELRNGVGREDRFEVRPFPEPIPHAELLAARAGGVSGWS